MVSALVLVNTNLGDENKVLENIKSVEGVETANSVWGVYDLMVTVKTDSIDKLKEISTNKLRKVNGVTSMLTLILEEESKRR